MTKPLELKNLPDPLQVTVPQLFPTLVKGMTWVYQVSNPRGTGGTIEMTSIFDGAALVSNAPGYSQSVHSGTFGPGSSFGSWTQAGSASVTVPAGTYLCNVVQNPNAKAWYVSGTGVIRLDDNTFAPPATWQLVSHSQ